MPAVPHQLSVRARPARAGDRLPASDGEGTGDAPRHRPADDQDAGGRSAPRSHRPRSARWRLGPRRRSTRWSVPSPARSVAGCWHRSPVSRRSDAWRRTPGDGSRAHCGSRPRTGGPAPDRRVTMFPTCLVEYRRPEIGHALVDVYCPQWHRVRHRRVGCCGAPWLTAGDTRRFAAQAARNVTTLAAAIRAGTDVVVAQPTCHAVITTDYVDMRRSGASTPSWWPARTFDAVTYLADHVERSSRRRQRRSTPVSHVGASDSTSSTTNPATGSTTRPPRRPPAARADRGNGRRGASLHGCRRPVGAARRQRADRPRHRPRARRRDPNGPTPTSSLGAAFSPTSPSKNRPGGR